jgi:signal transduction histidine kinase
MTRLQLRGRVTLASIVVLTGGMLAVSVAVNFLLDRSLDADANSVLRERAAAQLAALTVRRNAIRPNQNANDAVLDQQSWVFAAGRELERPRGRAVVERSVRALSQVTRPTYREPAGTRVRLFATPVVGGPKPLGTIVVGVSLEPYDHTQHLALLATAVLDLFVVLIGALVARRAVGAALRPVAEMSARARDWSEHDLHRRFALGPPRDEITALAATLDGMLARIDAVVRHEQRLSAELAHELRTPLSGVRAEAELALRPGRPEPELRAALEQVLAGTDRMAAVIQTLLASERATAAAATESCDPSDAIGEVLTAMRPAAAAHGVEIAVHRGNGTASVLAGRALIAQAVAPLLDNAIHHAVSRVDVRVEARGPNVVIALEDDGPGIGPGDPESLFAAGASTTGGAGLGLPLARRLARSLGGDVTAMPAASGGRFELRLPGA